MKWYSVIQDMRTKQPVDFPMSDGCMSTMESCEVLGACGKGTANDTLRMALELALDGKTTAHVGSNARLGPFHDLGRAYCAWHDAKSPETPLHYHAPWGTCEYCGQRGSLESTPNNKLD